MTADKRFCPLVNGKCSDDCALQFCFPERPPAVCFYQALLILLYDIKEYLAELKTALNRTSWKP